MDPDLSKLDAFLEDAGTDGYLQNVAPSTDANQYYLTGFFAGDPFTSLYVDGQVVLLVSGLEYARAKSESRADVVKRWSDYDVMEKVKEYGREESAIMAYQELFAEFGVESVSVPSRFPASHADGLEDAGIPAEPETEGILDEIRGVKTAAEIEHVHEAQRANEVAMERARSLIEGASVGPDGELVHEGEALTSERVRQEIEVTLIREGCGMDEAIVACGPDGGEPHNRGHGPLRADEPIIVDIFPRNRTTKYFGDMTRTFVKGEADETVRGWYELTREALNASLDAVEPGATGEEVHDAACDVYEAAGYPTLRSDPATETGFIHSTGHGVGLEVHEAPRLSPTGDELEPGHVITIEPGLYDPELGGMRLEDLVVVTEDGYQNLTDYPLDLELD